MLEFKFITQISDSIKVYREFPLPALICDNDFHVHWSNQAAKSQFSALTRRQGILEVLSGVDLEEVRQSLDKAGNYTVLRSLPPEILSLSFSPIFSDGKPAGIAALCIPGNVSSKGNGVFQGTHAAETLAQSIRSAVSDMFDAMDAVAYKADMMQVGWMKLGLNRVSMTGYGILRITGNVTEFTRYQQSDPRSFLKLSAVNLAVLLEQLRPEVEKLSGMAGIPVEFPHSHDLPYLLLDTAQFQLAFYNLLHNCISYTKPENRIDISLQKKEDGVALTITDRGLGIPTDQLETVLRPYHTYRHNGGRVGAGLGLSLVQLITEAHAGKLSIRSSAGEGTAATLLFPRISFTQPLPLAQPTFARAVPDRFSAAYVGLVDAVYQANPEQSLSPQIGPAGQGLSL